MDTETLTYTFDGRPLTRTVSHGGPDSQVLAACGADLETFAYSYDHAGRLLTLTHQLDGQTTRTLLSNTYDELGRLLTTTRGGTVTTTNGYNLHGWLTSSESTPFKEYLYYEQSHNGSSAQYGGNISAVDWKTSDNVLRGYAFTYDGLSRLTQAYLRRSLTADTGRLLRGRQCQQQVRHAIHLRPDGQHADPEALRPAEQQHLWAD